MTAPRRIGLLGDIHAEDASLAFALRVLGDDGADLIVAVGDIVDGSGDVDRCCELLSAARAIVVRGNHERWFLAGSMRELPDATLTVSAESRRFLAALPAQVRVDIPGGQLLVCHGIGDDDMASVDPDADAFAIWHHPPLTALLDEDRPLLVLNGHSHRRGVWRHAKLTFVNGGTLYREHQPCFALVDLEGGAVTYSEIHRGGRIGFTETIALSMRGGWR